MLAGICSIHFLIYRSSHSMVLFKKDVVRIIQTVYRRTPIQKCDFKCSETTLLHESSSVNMLHICRRTPFIENISGKLLLYIVLNMEVINVEVLSKQLNCLKYISIIKTLLLTLYVSFTWWPNISFQMPMWLLKKHKGGDTYTSLVPELRSQVLCPVVGRLTLSKTSYVLGCLVFWKEVL